MSDDDSRSEDNEEYFQQQYDDEMEQEYQKQVNKERNLVNKESHFFEESDFDEEEEAYRKPIIKKVATHDISGDYLHSFSDTVSIYVYIQFCFKSTYIEIDEPKLYACHYIRIRKPFVLSALKAKSTSLIT